MYHPRFLFYRFVIAILFYPRVYLRGDLRSAIYDIDSHIFHRALKRVPLSAPKGKSAVDINLKAGEIN